MHKALLLKYPDSVIPSETTVYRVMTAIGITHRPNRKPNGITKVDREARKSDDLLKRDFKADKPFSKCVTDITEVKAKNGKLYVSAIFDCYDLTAIGLSMDDNKHNANTEKYAIIKTLIFTNEILSSKTTDFYYYLTTTHVRSLP